jgi:hypothetical protein
MIRVVLLYYKYKDSTSGSGLKASSTRPTFQSKKLLFGLSKLSIDGL